jgi:hypothetical protein
MTIGYLIIFIFTASGELDTQTYTKTFSSYEKCQSASDKMHRYLKEKPEVIAVLTNCKIDV